LVLDRIGFGALQMLAHALARIMLPVGDWQ
jgi:hypothetical protein